MSAAESSVQAALEQLVKNYVQRPNRSELERQLMASSALINHHNNLASEGKLEAYLQPLIGDWTENSRVATGDLVQLICDIVSYATRPPSDDTPQHLPGMRGIYPFLSPAQQPDEMGRLGGHRVLAALGQGGMGIVFLAEDLALRRQVALKVMQPSLAQSAVARERFLREARAVAKLVHENVVVIHQVGEANGMPFLVMPLLTGETLETRLRRERALPIADMPRFGLQMAEGLAAAQAVGMIHRDIKPANVWLYVRPSADSVPAREPTVKLLDFGLARSVAGDSVVSPSGGAAGTPGYMSPEQIEEKELHKRSDLFSLGPVLYRMATGELAFPGTTAAGLLIAVLRHIPPSAASVRKEVPPALPKLIDRLLAKDRTSGRWMPTPWLKLFGSRHRITRPGEHPKRRYRRI